MTYYHIYNRGAHKEPIFRDGSDYWRMLKLLYIANNTEPFRLIGLRDKDIFSNERKSILVDVIAYCLMPNHIHLAIRDRVDKPDRLPAKIGNYEVSPSSQFIHKLCTAYSGYFNKKYNHSGTIWQGPYKCKEVLDEEYLRILIDYIHLNPYGIITPDMTKEARAENRSDAIEYSRNYEYSSLKDYLGIGRPQATILSLRGDT